MSIIDKDSLLQETNLNADAQARLQEIGWVDLVIGIPSHRNGRTIGEVVKALADGIAMYFPNERVLLMNADGGSSDNTVRHVLDAKVSSRVEKLVTVYEGMRGKGTGIRSIFEAALRLDARACVIVEARAPGITPEWLPALVNPVLRGHDISMGCYQRSANAAALTDNLAYPFLGTFFRADLREPLAGEFCVSGDLAAELVAQDVWETDVARFGINIWLALQVLVEHRRIALVDLGYRGENGGELGALLDARFLHTVGTLFRALVIHRRWWQENGPVVQVPLYGERHPPVEMVCSDECVRILADAMFNAKDEYAAEWQRILFPQTYESVLDILNQPRDGFSLPTELWARIVSEFAIVYNKGEGDPDKVAEALLPLYYGRAAHYVQSTQNLTALDREEVVQDTVRAFQCVRPFFIEHWNNYDSSGDVAEYWF
jgi:hypothetical protein